MAFTPQQELYISYYLTLFYSVAAPRYLLAAFCLLPSPQAASWGFWAHKKINHTAVLSLPPQMGVLYKKSIALLTERAIAPDQRRYAVADEGQRHYIDLEAYGDDIPKHWQDAVARYGPAACASYGSLPWHIPRMMRQLQQAFEAGHTTRILHLSADLGHYIADAHVPLHTTANYNGQLTGQEGIHALWESRLPELFGATYPLATGPPRYLHDPLQEVWQVVYTSHQLSHQVLALDKALRARFPKHQQYTFEPRGTQVRKQHSRAYAQAYHEALQGMVAQRMRAAIHMASSIWYTCWVNAGQPDLTALAAGQQALERTPQDTVVTGKRLPACRARHPQLHRKQAPAWPSQSQAAQAQAPS